MGKIMYMNFKQGEAKKHYGEEHAVPDATWALPVELLANTAGYDGQIKARAMAECSLVLACGENGAMVFTADKNDKFDVPMDELSETPVLAFREKGDGDAAWEMPFKERAPYEAVWENHKGMTAERAGEIFDQAEQFGAESLAPEDQDLLSMDRGKMMSVGAMMYQCGRMSEDYIPGISATYSRTDTGRYLQIRMKGDPDNTMNVYEAPVTGEMHQFWNMEPGEGKIGYTSIREGDFTIEGIYAGAPYQAEREKAADLLYNGPKPDHEYGSVGLDHGDAYGMPEVDDPLEDEGPDETPAPEMAPDRIQSGMPQPCKPASRSALDQMRGAIADMDEKDAGPDVKDGGKGILDD